MLINPSETQAILDTPASCDAIQQIKAIAAMTIRALDNIMMAEEDGEIDADIADETMQDIIAEQNELQCTALSIPLLEIQDEIEQIIAVGSPAEDFGVALTALLATEFDSLEEGIDVVSQNTGIDPDTIVAYCNNNAVPSKQEAIAIGRCFDCCHADPSALEHLIALAGNDMADYSGGTMSAEFNAVAAKQQQLDREREIAHRFRAIEHQANRLYQDRRITPEQMRRLVPQGIEADERQDYAAFFSMTCDRLGTSAEEQLGRIESTLNFLAQGPQIDPILMADFSSYATDTLVEMPNAKDEAALNEYRSRVGYG